MLCLHNPRRHSQLCCVLMCFRSGVRCFPHGGAGHKKLAVLEQETQACISRGVSCTPGLNSSWQPTCHGIRARPRDIMESITHQPEDSPYEAFGPHLPCDPPMSYGSSRFEGCLARFVVLTSCAVLAIIPVASFERVPTGLMCSGKVPHHMASTWERFADVQGPCQALARSACQKSPPKRTTRGTQLS